MLLVKTQVIKLYEENFAKKKLKKKKEKLLIIVKLIKRKILTGIFWTSTTWFNVKPPKIMNK